MKIAIPAAGKDVSQHFGHCASFKIFEIENQAIVKQSTVDNLANHQPGVLPALMQQHGVNVVIASGIGKKAIEIFNRMGIKVICGVTGSIANVLTQFINGTLQSSGNACSH